MDRLELFAMIERLPAGNVDDVYRYVAGMLAAATGPAECMCCGHIIDDVTGKPACGREIKGLRGYGGTGSVTLCSNDGAYWKPLHKIGATIGSQADG